MNQKMTRWTLALILSSLLGAGSLPAAAGGNNDVPVAEAALRSDLVQLRSLLEQGVDVNTAQGDGMTALHWAARNNDVEAAQMLLYAGANLEARTRLGAYTPLLIAARNGSSELVETLLAAGADPQATTTAGTTALMLAAASGEVAAVTSLLEHGAAIDARDQVMGQTALMFASASNRADVVQVLLDRGSDPDATSAVVDMAAMAKKDAELKQERNKKLKEAIEAERKAAAAKETAETKDVSEEGRAGLENGDPPDSPKQDQKKTRKQASKRTEKSPDKKKGKKQGFFARLFGLGGSEKGKSESPRPRRLGLADLVGQLGGLSPLHFACREGHLESVKKLLAGGADINQLTAGDKSSPLLIATINGRFDLAMYLLEQGADPNLASEANATPLYAVVNVQWAPHAFYPQPTTKQEKTAHLELIQALLDHGADPNVRLNKKVWYTGYNFDQSGVDEAGATPFWRAAQSSDVEAMKILVAAGADPFLPTVIVPERRLPNGRNADSDLDENAAELGGPAVSPLHAATGAGYDGNYHRNSPAGWMPAVRYLVDELGADVNAPDHEGYTPLHNAAARGDNEMIRYLVSKGADVTAVSKKGQTTADMANGPVQRIQPFPETLELLVSLGAKNSGKCVSC